MKKTLLTIMFVPFLSGCAVLDAFLMTHYDSAEYSSITAIRSTAKIAAEQCTDHEQSRTNAITIANLTQYFEFYAEKIPRNDEGYKAAKSLNKIATTLKNRYLDEDKVSQNYCETKFKSIELSSNLIQQTVGDRPR